MRQPFPLISLLVLACTGSRLYFVDSELLKVEGNPRLVVAPGPWEHKDLPEFYSDAASVPDDLVLAALKALMALPGATDACDSNTGRPRRDAAEYCVAFYRTPDDWRVSWPIRNLMGELNSCNPPLGGVEDKDFGRDLPIFGFAHNHPCGTSMSSSDLKVFPVGRSTESGWMMVEYAMAPNGTPARNSRGELIPAWGWLATGRADAPRFYKWNAAGEVFQWGADTQQWKFQAMCQPQKPSNITLTFPPPKCSPELN